MLGTVEYSEKEMRMFAYFRMDKVAHNIAPVLLYSMLASRAFVEDDQSYWAASLRRCVEALETGSVKRLTPEWDALIVEEKQERSFFLTGTEFKKFKEWDDAHYPKCKYYDDCSSPVSPTGAIGGRLTFSFTPNGVGVTTVVRCACGEEINVTDYDVW